MRILYRYIIYYYYYYYYMLHAQVYPAGTYTILYYVKEGSSIYG